MKADKALWKSLALLTQLSYLILIPMLLCLLLGRWIDQKTGQDGLWTLILLLVGLLAALRNFIVWCRRQVQRSRQEEERRGFDEGPGARRKEEQDAKDKR